MDDKKEMTRGQQTAWIVGAMALAAGGWLYYDTRLPDGHKDKSCQRIFGVSKECVGERAMAERAAALAPRPPDTPEMIAEDAKWDARDAAAVAQ